MTCPTTIHGAVPVEVACPGHIPPVSSPALSFIAPAYEAAIAECNDLYGGILNFSITFLPVQSKNVRDARALMDLSYDLIGEWYYKKRRNSDGFSSVIAAGGLDTTYTHQLTASWNILYFTTVGYTKSAYTLSGPPALATTVISVETLARTLLSLLDLYQWNTTFILTDLSAPSVFIAVADDIQTATLRSVKRQNLTQYRRTVISSHLDSFRVLLLEFQTISRVLIFLGRSDQLRRLLIEAARQNLTNGEFVYICFEPYRFAKNYGNYSWDYGDAEDELAREAFQSLLVIHPQDRTPNPEWMEHALNMGSKFRERAKEMFNISYNAVDQPLWDVLASYSTIKMYCQIVNESLQSTSLGLLKDGRRLVDKFLNSSFEDEFSDIYIDRSGIRRTTLIVSHHARHARTRQAFLISPQDSHFQLQIISHPLVNSDIPDWPGGFWPPANEPRCGFRHENLLCQPQADSITKQPFFISLVALACCTSVLLIIPFAWKHFHHGLDTEFWRILPEHLTLSRRVSEASSKGSVATRKGNSFSKFTVLEKDQTREVNKLTA